MSIIGHSFVPCSHARFETVCNLQDLIILDTDALSSHWAGRRQIDGGMSGVLSRAFIPQIFTHKDKVSPLPKRDSAGGGVRYANKKDLGGVGGIGSVWGIGRAGQQHLNQHMVSG